MSLSVFLPRNYILDGLYKVEVFFGEESELGAKCLFSTVSGGVY